MSGSKILVTSSTGNVGLPLSKKLYSENIQFTAATRDDGRAKDAMGFDTETVYLDFKDPSGFSKALEGKELLFLCGPSATPGAEKLLVPLLEEAKRSGIKHVVFIASYPGLMEYIEKSGMDYTFLKANFFMQNFEMYQTEDIRDKNRIFMPSGDGKAPFIHTRDIGEVAAEVLKDPSAYSKETLYLTGPETMDHYKVAEIFSKVLGRKINYEAPDDETYFREMKERGFSDEYIKAMIAVFGKIKRRKVMPASDTVKKILGRNPHSLQEYAEERRNIFIRD
ncbi:MAG: NmrA family NAD(P)-binding protein [Bacteroidales bacterium]|nr:NmrA family NAD(P)-binding protein [Bacteroidales bacterium]